MKRDVLDQLFSQYIRQRANYRCQRCQRQHAPKSQGLHCAHVFSRGKLSVRFAPSNALALCYGCHRLCDQHKETILYPLYVKLYGQTAFDVLRLQANTPKKIDRAGIRVWLETELKEMAQRKLSVIRASAIQASFVTGPFQMGKPSGAVFLRICGRNCPHPSHA